MPTHEGPVGPERQLIPSYSNSILIRLLLSFDIKWHLRSPDIEFWFRLPEVGKLKMFLDCMGTELNVKDLILKNRGRVYEVQTSRTP